MDLQAAPSGCERQHVYAHRAETCRLRAGAGAPAAALGPRWEPLPVCSYPPRSHVTWWWALSSLRLVPFSIQVTGGLSRSLSAPQPPTASLGLQSVQVACPPHAWPIHQLQHLSKKTWTLIAGDCLPPGCILSTKVCGGQGVLASGNPSHGPVKGKSCRLLLS